MKVILILCVGLVLAGCLDNGGGTAPEDTFDRGGRHATSLVSEIGSYLLTGTEEYDEFSLDHFTSFSGTRDIYSFAGWGVWGTVDGVTLFRVTISGTNIQNGPSTARVDPYSTNVTGRRSFDNPVGHGNAVWTGEVRAYETHPETFGTPVKGDARLEMDLDDDIFDTIEVDFTNFDGGHSDMSWNSVFVSLGGFQDYYPGELEGNFYGDEHEGVAGTFDRDGLKGVFGAVRE